MFERGVVYMKDKFKIICVFIFLLLCIVFGIKYGMQIQYNNELVKIEASRNTELDNYKSNKALAESYLQVYDIVDEDSYQQVKNDMYHSFSSEMQKELFSSVNYEGLLLHEMNTELIRVMGTNNGSNQKNTFLLEYRLTGVNYDKVICNLIDIENGQIIKVTKIN